MKANARKPKFGHLVLVLPSTFEFRHLRTSVAFWAILPLLAAAGLGGCNRGPAGLVPVSGKLTLDGGPWPKQGVISFAPLNPAPGHPVLPGVAKIEPDGSFAIKTEVAPGLVPGEYLVAVQCWLDAPDEKREGKSAIAERYRNPQTSELKVSVPEGSGPIKLSWDIKSK